MDQLNLGINMTSLNDLKELMSKLEGINFVDAAYRANMLFLTELTDLIKLEQDECTLTKLKLLSDLTLQLAAKKLVVKKTSSTKTANYKLLIGSDNEIRISLDCGGRFNTISHNYDLNQFEKTWVSLTVYLNTNTEIDDDEALFSASFDLNEKLHSWLLGAQFSNEPEFAGLMEQEPLNDKQILLIDKLTSCLSV